MRWNSILILLFISATSLFCYLLINLNNKTVEVDLLFFELDISIGLILLIFFLAGVFTTLVLELINFFRRRGEESE